MTIRDRKVIAGEFPKRALKLITYKDKCRYEVTSEDGKSGVIDLKPFLWGEVFEDIKRTEVFRKAYVDKYTKTIT